MVNTSPLQPQAAPGNATAPEAQPAEVYPTVKQIIQACPSAEPDNVRRNLPYILKAMAEGGLLSKNQLIGIIGTIGVETIPRFVPVREGGGSRKHYAPWFGRGYIQLTWRANYEKASRDLNIPGLVENPDLALEPETSAKILVWYWKGATGNNPSRFAEQGDWQGVRRAVNGGTNGLREFMDIVNRAVQIFDRPIDPTAVGAIAVDGSYGLGCVDAGSGGTRSLSQLNPQSQGNALAHALGITARAMAKALEFRATLDPAADPKILDLDAQKTFEVKGFGEGLDGIFTCDEVVFEFNETLEVRVVGYQPDPNAPAPQVFRHDATQGLAPTQPQLPPGPVPVGEIPGRIFAAAQAAKGRSSRNGPGRGRVACAWTTNLFCILPAGLQNIGNIRGQDNVTVGVVEMVKALEGGRGQRVQRSQAIPGDIWVSPGQRHIGIYVGNNKVLSNSSSRASFAWEDDIEDVNRFYGSSQEYGIFRVLN